MLTVIIGGLLCIVLIGSMYWLAAIFRHSQCDLPGNDYIQVPTVLAWLFWGGRKDHRRDPLGVFVQVGSIVGVIIAVITILTPLTSPIRRLLAMAIFVAPFIVIAAMNLIYQIICKFRS
jgi:prepilin signal peptidase PulO-like enzyme (type II secretory pathway)